MLVEPLAPYLAWAKHRPKASIDLALSNLLGCTVDDLPGARGELSLGGLNDDGYPPLVEAIAARYQVDTRSVATATGTSGANFLVLAALLAPGDDVLVEAPAYDPLVGVPRLLGASVSRFERRFDEQYAIAPWRIREALTPRTRLVVVTNLHNPSGVLADENGLREVGEIVVRAGAHVLVDEVYLDTVHSPSPRSAAHLGDHVIVTSSLTKSYGLGGLRCGWVVAAPAIAERVRRVRDLVDGAGSFPSDVLSLLAFRNLDTLMSRARRLLDSNFARLEAFMATRRDLAWVAPQGGTVAFPRVLGIDDTRGLADRLLRQYDTAVVPGAFFEEPRHVRLSFGGPPEQLGRGLAAIGRALDDEVRVRRPIGRV